MVWVTFTEMTKSGHVRNVEHTTFQSRKQFYEWLNGTARMKPAYPGVKPVPDTEALWYSEYERLYIAIDS